MDHHTSRRGTRAASAIVVLTAAIALLAPSGAAAAPLKPDLVADPPAFSQTQLIDDYTVPGRLLLRFDSWIHNAGPGCVHLIGTNRQGGLMTTVVQRLYEPGACASRGPAHTDVPLPTGSQMKYETNDSHQHWHFMAAARYSLWTGAMTKEVGPGSKVGFCLLDSENVDGLVASPIFPEYSIHHCNAGQDTADSAEMGLSPGWRDIYQHWLRLQWVDITNIRPGVYRVAAEMDPENRIIEENEVNPPAFSAPVTIPGYLARAVRKRLSAARTSPLRLRTRKVGAASGKAQFRIVTRPKHGKLSQRAGRWFTGGSVRYTPRAGYTGRDSFRFAVRDGAFPRKPPAAKVSLKIVR